MPKRTSGRYDARLWRIQREELRSLQLLIAAPQLQYNVSHIIPVPWSKARYLFPRENTIPGAWCTCRILRDSLQWIPPYSQHFGVQYCDIPGVLLYLQVFQGSILRALSSLPIFRQLVLRVVRVLGVPKYSQYAEYTYSICAPFRKYDNFTDGSTSGSWTKLRSGGATGVIHGFNTLVYLSTPKCFGCLCWDILIVHVRGVLYWVTR